MENTALREKLMNLYLQLSFYPEVPKMLKTLKDNGLQTGILSNGSRGMLNSAVENLALDSALDASLPSMTLASLGFPPGLRNGDGPIFACALRDLLHVIECMGCMGGIAFRLPSCVGKPFRPASRAYARRPQCRD